jgi:hypothetical protein
MQGYLMEYTSEVLDRSTGNLLTVSMGDWIPVTELGKHYGVGKKQVRQILYHMGLLQREGRSYRLPWEAVEKGYGKRHDNPKSGRAFDVISPLGQQLVAEIWDETVADYEADLRKDSKIDEARDALAAFKETRIGNEPLHAEGEVRWLRHQFPEMTHDATAIALEISPPLVRKYVDKQAAQRAYWDRRKANLSGDRVSVDPTPRVVENFCGVLEIESLRDLR